MITLQHIYFVKVKLELHRDLTFVYLICIIAECCKHALTCERIQYILIQRERRAQSWRLLWIRFCMLLERSWEAVWIFLWMISHWSLWIEWSLLMLLGGAPPSGRTFRIWRRSCGGRLQMWTNCLPLVSSSFQFLFSAEQKREKKQKKKRRLSDCRESESQAETCIIDSPISGISHPPNCGLPALSSSPGIT